MRASPSITTIGVTRNGHFSTINAVFNAGFTTHAQSFSDAGSASTIDSDWSGTIIADAEL